LVFVLVWSKMIVDVIVAVVEVEVEVKVVWLFDLVVFVVVFVGLLVVVEDTLALTIVVVRLA